VLVTGANGLVFHPAVTGHNTRALVSYRPIPEVEDRFGKLPPLHVPRAEACVFHHDGTFDVLVQRALQSLAEEHHV